VGFYANYSGPAWRYFTQDNWSIGPSIFGAGHNLQFASAVSLKATPGNPIQIYGSQEYATRMFVGGIDFRAGTSNGLLIINGGIKLDLGGGIKLY
jgi:hypothetical protein